MLQSAVGAQTTGLTQLRRSPALFAAHRPALRRIRGVPTKASASLSLGAAEQPASKLSPLNPQWWHLESPKAEADGENPEISKKAKLLPALLARLWALVSKDKGLLAAASFFMVAAALAELAIPHFATSCIFSAAAANSAVQATFQPTLRILAGIIITYGVMSACRGYCFSILNNRLTMQLRTQLFGALIRRDIAFFDKTDTGTLTSRLQADCQAMTKCVATNLNIAMRNLLQAIGGVIYLSITSPVMCAATLGVCALLWGVTLFYGDYARRTQRVYQDTLACGNQVAEEVLTLSRTVRTFGTEGQEEGRYSNWLQRLYNVGLRQATGYGLFVMTGHIATYMTKVVALAIGCVLVVKGQLTAEQLTNFLFYVEFVTYASLSACDEVVEVMEAVGASERVLDLLEQPAAPQVASGRVLGSFSGNVELRDVSFSYPSRPGATALSGVNLQLQPGRLVALVGLSGSGKTTLVALLQRLYDPAGGCILIDGVDLRELDAGWYRSQLGVVQQDPRLFTTTVAENIAYGFPGATREDIIAAAKEANAHAFITALPQGYDTPVTDKLLSGGQRQRVALARALVRKPRLLILDEATSALDAESEAQVQAALDAAMTARNRTVLVIAHRLSTVRNADMTVVMDKGQVVEVGTHKTLLEQRGIYYNLVSRQQGPGDSLEQSPQKQYAHAHSAVQVPNFPQPVMTYEDEEAWSLSNARPSGGSARVRPGGVNGQQQQNGAVHSYANGSNGSRSSSSSSSQSDYSSSNLNGNAVYGLAAAVSTSSLGSQWDGSEQNGIALTDHLHGMSSGDEIQSGHVDGPHGSHGPERQGSQDVDSLLQAATAAAVTAETDLLSKVLGSQDPIDFGAGN